MKQSEQIGQLIEALALAKLDFQPILRSKRAGKEGEKFSYMYSPIENVLAAVTPALSANQLALIGDVELSADGVMALMTRLVHASDQFIETTIPLGKITGDIKAIGSAITYGRRYGISTLLQVAADDDDDGAATESGQVVGRKGSKAVTTGAAPTTPAPEPLRAPLSEALKATHPKPSVEDIDELLDLMNRVYAGDRSLIREKLRVAMDVAPGDTLTPRQIKHDMTQAQYEFLRIAATDHGLAPHRISEDDVPMFSDPSMPPLPTSEPQVSDESQEPSVSDVSPTGQPEALVAISEPEQTHESDTPDVDESPDGFRPLETDAAGHVVEAEMERLVKWAGEHRQHGLLLAMRAETPQMTAGRYRFCWVQIAEAGAKMVKV